VYIRNFDGAFLYLIQNLANENWQLVLKYDWYDPNTNVSGEEIGSPTTNFTRADVKFSTLGIGLTRYFSENLKMLAYYDVVRNEKAALDGFYTDRDDNILTIRMQLKF
jgi:phosphate-selective porin